MELMQQALSLLDQAGDADSCSVHLDLAIERLRDLLAHLPAMGPVKRTD